MAPVDGGDTRSDAELCRAVRDGDVDAWEALWRRHYDVGLRTARAVESQLSPEDLVSEAFVRIAETLRGGGGKGPLAGLFRPYLYVTIRSLAARSWRIREEPEELDELEQVQWVHSVVAPASEDVESKLNDSLLVQSFAALPKRWQEVLWYSEVERLSGAEVGHLMGLKEPAVASLAYRARRALRAGWIQRHVASEATEAECRVVLSHLGEYSARVAAANVRTLIDDHLGSCTTCRIAHEDADVIASQLGSVLVPVLLGVSVLPATLGGGAAPTPPPPPLPGTDAAAARESAGSDGATAVAGASRGAAVGTGAWGTVLAIVGVVAIVLGLGAAALAVLQPWNSSEGRLLSGSKDRSAVGIRVADDLPEDPAPSSASQTEPRLTDADGVELTLNAADEAGNVSPDATMVLAVSVPAEVDASKLTSNATTLTGAAGAAEPGLTATVTDAAGTVVGSSVVNPDGSFRVALNPAQADGAEVTLTLTDATGDAPARRE